MFGVVTRYVTRRRGTPLTVYTVGLSNVAVKSRTFLRFLHRRFIACTVPPRVVYFRVARADTVTGLTDTVEFVGRLGNLNYRFSLSSFYTKVSSFTCLGRLPMSFLGVSKDFIGSVLSSPVGQTVIRIVGRVNRIVNGHAVTRFIRAPRVRRTLLRVNISCTRKCMVRHPRLFGYSDLLDHPTEPRPLLFGTPNAFH